MGKPLKEITKEVKDEFELYKLLKEYSLQYGGAWVFDIVPFSHKTHFRMYKNKSSVPDYYIDFTHGKIAVKGQITGFTAGAVYRENQRGYSGDR